MKFVFISNYINHHQIPFCNAMYELLGEEFVFLQTEPMEEERIRMGWQEDAVCPYLLKYYDNPEYAAGVIADCDVAFFGGTDEESYIAGRLQAGKPVIRYSERLYKEAQWKAISPRGLRKKYLDHTRYRREQVYMLCAGAYVPSDFQIVRAYPDKLLRWGYFPETKHYDVDTLFAEKKPGNILWAARFLDWKHPELPMRVAKWLKEQDLDFHMDIIGGGELQQKMEGLLAEYDLQDKVALLGYRTPSEVRRAMERADIYLATSDRMEGWGAVINEAMNSGCAVVADHMMGAAPFLVESGRNGILYRDGDEDMLCRQVEKLVRDRKLCRRLGEAAYRTITEQWNAENAAKQLVALCVRLGFLQEQDINVGTGELILEEEFPLGGPCSKAPVIGERKMFDTLMEAASAKLL